MAMSVQFQQAQLLMLFGQVCECVCVTRTWKDALES